MKRTMLAILALSPVLLHAQSKSPAQPESTPVLQSTNLQPVLLAAGYGATAGAAASTPRRISTGVVPPVLIYKAELTQNSMFWADLLRDHTVGVAFTLDESGKPTDIKITKSAGGLVDSKVLSSVSEYRYQPATLNGAPTTIDVNLTVNVR